VYHTSVIDLERKSLIAFFIDFAEAAADLAEEQKRREEQMSRMKRTGFKKHKRYH
jgi:hypothetical protein